MSEILYACVARRTVILAQHNQGPVRNAEDIAKLVLAKIDADVDQKLVKVPSAH